ncbi:hypothetical protein SFHH103_01691 [Sinorhizobium fredii HH103]|uniref:Uncharacterized protein n=1 Tax=Sinorhizobium fredii (strain HH103) TaxID=1117943 RepID=G9A7F8_SINF1|nr:hypothetical protein SFHH103_01691 [Sinorhizobium fredii HH103]
MRARDCGRPLPYLGHAEISYPRLFTLADVSSVTTLA